MISLLCLACGGDSPSAPGEGCTTDDQCKGDRICVDKQCVDPEDSMGGGSEAGSAAGSGGAGSGGSAGKSGSGGVPDSPELEEACMKNCEARLNASCPMNTGSLDQCRAQCLIIDEQNYGYCLEEQTAQYACLASGGYTCVSGYPQQKSTCVTESQALSTCNQKAPCRRFCEKAAGKCAPAGDQCLTTCLDEQKSFSDAICNIYYTQLVSCWGQNLTCNGDIPTVAPCGPAAAQVADCVARRNHACDGFCWLAGALGCGSDSCVSSCKAKADETTCGRYYRSLVECSYRSNATNMTCEAGEPTPTSACNSERDQYTKCMNPT
ncbi:MAG TPA: hypothetical protein VJV78_25945 [Polyangiales bacterium]|nr:hypothetical protein [Polyangiales bacterium]